MILQDCNRYMVIHKDKILCVKGWANERLIDSNQIRTFKSPAAIRQYFENSSYKKPKYEVRRINVRIEVIDDDK